jgi:hypothetical protein
MKEIHVLFGILLKLFEYTIFLMKCMESILICP